MRSFLRDPLLHFLLIGAALFLIFELSDDPAGPESGRIVISSGQIEFLRANFTRTWKRPPSDKELKGLVDNYVHEEILYREALALGLDKNDRVVRQRLKQKVEMINDDLAGLADPSDEELQQYLLTVVDRTRSHITMTPEQTMAQIDLVVDNFSVFGQPKVAIIVSADYDFGMVRMFELSAEDRIPHDLMVFRDVPEACDWLGLDPATIVWP